ncbi:MAG TPA: DEAD/DEAH box helicase [Thermoleophilaceae bacterium]|nr:DEAD/DEAH box helicase [Thermoleophilaceae bacterium]
MTTFADLGLSQEVLDALDHLGYKDPTPIQQETIPLLLQGRDVIGQAQTGTGKTAAFGLPLLDYLDPSDPSVQALVLTPTRELCIQVTQALRAYGAKRGIEVVAVFGGAPIRDQASRLKQEAQVVVGTVGRVMDMIRRHYLFLDQTRYVVLDEADEMLDLGFFEDVDEILARCPSGRQTALFSATMPPPIKKLAEKRMFDPETIKVKAAQLTIDTVAQFHIEVADKDKAERLGEVLKAERPTQAIIFARTKIGVDRLARTLDRQGLRVKTLHGNMSQGARDGVMIAFKGGREKLLVATDVAARGLDITGVSHVVNYDVPNSPDVYVHRIGRTGRAGETGRAITLITPKQHEDLEAIERHANTEIPVWTAPNGGAPASRRPKREDAPKPEQAEEAPAAVADEPAPVETRTPPVAEEKDEEPREGDRPRRRRGRGGGGRKRSDEVVVEPAAIAAAQPASDEDERPQTRRPRHTKPRPRDGSVAKLLIGAGRAQGFEPADLVGAIVDNCHLDGEDVRNVRVLERFSFVEVPADRASEVVEKVNGNEVRGVPLRLEVAKR